jgi:hypothetical protein
MIYIYNYTCIVYTHFLGMIFAHIFIPFGSRLDRSKTQEHSPGGT